MKLTFTSIAAGLAVSLATASFASPGDYYLYAPRRTTPDKVPTEEAGVLVREISIRRGDTLRAISQTHSGRASYFPQILLFNEIKNPDLIYEGRTLLVPVRKVGEKSGLPARRAAAKGKRRSHHTKDGAAASAKKAVGKGVSTGEGSVRENPEQVLFERAAGKYRSGSCREALPLFEEFLAKFPGSGHVPDVRLYRADCHLKLSQE